MAEETGRLLNAAINDGPRPGSDSGRRSDARSLDANALVRAHSAWPRPRRGSRIPLTVHVAIGTDIIHMHEDASGAAIGDTSLRDFRRFVANVARLDRGVYLNCGSAVVLPEVFLKAVALARNRGLALDGLTTVNLDFVRLYRPQTNVVSRPTAGIGKGYSITGHHELMLPLLAAALIEGGDRVHGSGFTVHSSGFTVCGDGHRRHANRARGTAHRARQMCTLPDTAHSSGQGTVNREP